MLKLKVVRGDLGNNDCILVTLGNGYSRKEQRKPKQTKSKHEGKAPSQYRSLKFIRNEENKLLGGPKLPKPQSCIAKERQGLNCKEVSFGESPSTDRRADRPEVCLPPQKRLCIALSLRYEVGESSSALTARPTGGFKADYGFVTTLDDESRRDPGRDVGYGIIDTWDEMLVDMLM
ncbi:hypothetical protein Tco_1215946 [Tanacetum coccineum]